MSIHSSPTEIPTASSVPSNVAIIGWGVLAIALVTAAVAGHAGPDRSKRPVATTNPTQKVDAPPSSDGMAWCELLYTTWSDVAANNGSAAYGASMRAQSALADCERGDFAGGKAELARLLRHGGIQVPPAQSALTR